MDLNRGGRRGVELVHLLTDGRISHGQEARRLQSLAALSQMTVEEEVSGSGGIVSPPALSILDPDRGGSGRRMGALIPELCPFTVQPPL
jgi:hypothetical protein